MFKAKFIGEDGSMGFKNGKVYELKSQCINDVIIIKTIDNELFCPYSRIETLLKNWILL